MPKVSEFFGISIYIYWRDQARDPSRYDRAAAVGDGMLYRIVDVEARPDYRVWIRFEDGTEGEGLSRPEASIGASSARELRSELPASQEFVNAFPRKRPDFM